MDHRSRSIGSIWTDELQGHGGPVAKPRGGIGQSLGKGSDRVAGYYLALLDHAVLQPCGGGAD